MSDTNTIPAFLEAMARQRCGGGRTHQEELVNHPADKSWEPPTLPRWHYSLWDLEEEWYAVTKAGYAAVPTALIAEAVEHLRKTGATDLAEALGASVAASAAVRPDWMKDGNEDDRPET